MFEDINIMHYFLIKDSENYRYQNHEKQTNIIIIKEKQTKHIVMYQNPHQILPLHAGVCSFQIFQCTRNNT